MKRQKSTLRGYAEGGVVGSPTLHAKPNFEGLAPYAKGMARGGKVEGPGGPTDDAIGPVMLSDGEYVLPADTVDAVGVEALEQLRKATHKPAKKNLSATGMDLKANRRELSSLRDMKAGMKDGGLYRGMRDGGPHNVEDEEDAPEFSDTSVDGAAPQSGRVMSSLAEAGLKKLIPRGILSDKPQGDDSIPTAEDIPAAGAAPTPPRKQEWWEKPRNSNIPDPDELPGMAKSSLRAVQGAAKDAIMPENIVVDDLANGARFLTGAVATKGAELADKARGKALEWAGAKAENPNALKEGTEEFFQMEDSASQLEDFGGRLKDQGIAALGGVKDQTIDTLGGVKNPAPTGQELAGEQKLSAGLDAQSNPSAASKLRIDPNDDLEVRAQKLRMANEDGESVDENGDRFKNYSFDNDSIREAYGDPKTVGQRHGTNVPSSFFTGKDANAINAERTSALRRPDTGERDLRYIPDSSAKRREGALLEQQMRRISNSSSGNPRDRRAMLEAVAENYKSQNTAASYEKQAQTRADASRYGSDQQAAASRYGHELGFQGDMARANSTLRAAQLGQLNKDRERLDKNYDKAHEKIGALSPEAQSALRRNPAFAGAQGITPENAPAFENILKDIEKYAPAGTGSVTGLDQGVDNDGLPRVGIVEVDGLASPTRFPAAANSGVLNRVRGFLANMTIPGFDALLPELTGGLWPTDRGYRLETTSGTTIFVPYKDLSPDTQDVFDSWSAAIRKAAVEEKSAAAKPN